MIAYICINKTIIYNNFTVNCITSCVNQIIFTINKLFTTKLIITLILSTCYLYVVS